MTVQNTITADVAERDVWRNGHFEADGWHRLADDEAIPADGRVLLSTRRFLAEAAAGTIGNKPVGVLVEPADRVAELAPHLDLLSVIAVDFPKYNDGRGFSHAAQLARLGFAGELRAVGNVLIDQIAFMRRLGFTAFEVTHAVTRRYLIQGKDPAPRHYYQPAVRDEPPAGTRPWLRRAAD
ncbi:DUF934 domain-containing protein [Chthonobacter albigriseus]|uniref:DUF934 domain-containing protein n=1 Tax=Chthonobacter albigriseus TaxID=1683161 RepID=UPI0015EED6A1|nr:DUF934 domain-containing protein [Chthonobacter albigriseus]